MHISDRVAQALLADGWRIAALSRKGDMSYTRTIATGGAFGRATQTLSIDLTGRWLARLDGWGTVERDVDLRDHTDPQAAIAAVLS